MLARLLTLAGAVLLLASLAVRYHRGRISLRKAMFWAAPWVFLAIVMLSPSLADAVAMRLGLEDANGIDLVVYLGVGVAFFFLHRIFLRIDRLEQSLTRLARHQALREAAGGEPPAAAETDRQPG
jgi:hypothetical protein